MTVAEGIVLTDVSVRRGGRTILDRLSLTVRRGRTTAVVGPSGTGKSTLLALLAQLDLPDAGSVRSGFSAGETGLVLQTYGLLNLLTAAENVELALQANGWSRPEVRSRTRSVLELLALGSVADHQIETLSGGQQQRIAVARALVLDPALLIADEFTSELDPANREVVIREVLGRAESGATVVIATHDLDLAGRCQDVLELSPAAAAGGRAGGVAGAR